LGGSISVVFLRTAGFRYFLTMLGENLDLSSDPELGPDIGSPAGRPFVGVRFACCDVYNRVYVNRSRTAYWGACPRCGKRVELKIAPHGTDSRFFTAY
jgi:hypothetical protein